MTIQTSYGTSLFTRKYLKSWKSAIYIIVIRSTLIFLSYISMYNNPLIKNEDYCT